MNDKDKKAFDIFYNKHYGFQDLRDAAIEAWKAACEYKQIEIDSIDCYIEKDEKIKTLQAEIVANLKECVEFYAMRKNDDPQNFWHNGRAIECLKDLGDK
jgi:hypothetical protein